ncbi:hypothetical protein DIS18_00490 [Algibacter marinivivus]|uniref:Lipocalin-like domain-containing protein n=1 Tax=Algibacter marinivivus TaxID=2100723 RepID=A0A2U2X5J3_9FLAO|nr:hypothetical protein [Algibacter marinivivus]PWH83067.1 hypothetical protein DIS18_00490 [Algibacter marinivivus]
MRAYLLIFTLLILTGCSSDDNKPKDETELVGKWKLIEQYLDLGDGSGDFQSINSNRTVEFFKDGTIEVNGILCFMSSEVGDKETGTYMITGSNEADTTFDGEIIPNTCSSRSAKVYFDLPLSGNLILWYQCIEGCGQKFEKI